MWFKSITRSFLRRLTPTISRVPVRHHNLEGENPAKAMTVNMLSQNEDDLVYIMAFSRTGFRLKNNFKIIGPLAVFPKSILHWNVRGPEDINEDSLSLFTMLEPKIDMLVLGIGDAGAKYDRSIVKYLRSHKINVEILPTDQACSTFNFLNDERRYVAGALIPPTELNDRYDEYIDFDMGKGGVFKKMVYEETPKELQDALKDMKRIREEASRKIIGRSEDDSGDSSKR